MTTTENLIEQDLIEKLRDLKYIHRDDIRDRASLEANFRTKFEELNRVRLSDAEFQRLLEQIVTPDVFGSCTVQDGTATEDLAWWESSDGTQLPEQRLQVSTKKIGDTVYALMIPV
jgi:hypothetical protein